MAEGLTAHACSPAKLNRDVMRVAQPLMVACTSFLFAFTDQLSRRGCPSTPSQSACKALPVTERKKVVVLQ